MAGHTHHHGPDEHGDHWARQHHEVGKDREPELGKATTALLEVARVRPGMHVLDVACGAGDTAAAATRLGAHATGIDSSTDMVRIASQRFPETTFLVGDMRTPPDGPWEAVLCRMGAHHADASWLSAAFAVLKPGGRLAIAERDAVAEEDRANGMRRIDEWTALFEATGFAEVEVVASAARFPGTIYVIAGTRPRGSAV